MTAGEKIRSAVDAHFAANQDQKHRTHLGASIIGRKCKRQLWYNFRWFGKTGHHTGRLLRLFQRGHDEEPRVVGWLQAIGAVVQDIDAETQKQFLFSALGGHYGGSCDGKISGLEAYGLDGVGVLEIKTHNKSSFSQLKSKGIATSKPEHYVQMQVYMGAFGCDWALYVAVCKNDDELFVDVVPRRDGASEFYMDLARDIITTRQPPKRYSEDSSFWVCKMCDFRDICHKDGKPETTSCRSCAFASADVDSGGWSCAKWSAAIPAEAVQHGCEAWESADAPT